MGLTPPRLVGVLSPFPILIACASAGARDANVITAPELSRSKAPTAYDAIQSDPGRNAPDPGPRHGRVFQGSAQPLVAVDNTLVGGVEVLQPLPPARWPGSNTSTLGWRPRDMGRDWGKE